MDPSPNDDSQSNYSYNPSNFLQSFQNLRHQIKLDSESSPDECTSTQPTQISSISKNGLTIAAVQLKTLPSTDYTKDSEAFLNRAIEAIETAVNQHNATLVLLQELFLGPYFCQSQEASLFALAEDIQTSPIVQKMQQISKSNNVILPFSLFERKNNAYFNSVVMIDSDGSILGIYRKSHIPDGTGYQEKFYFSPGDTGFQVFTTRDHYNIGVGICWDQWFPEAARSMALMGADVLLYPTAIGTEPQDPNLDSSDHWQRVMQGHAAANMIPVIASNRIGTEILLDDQYNEKQRITFYGRSFITDETGAIIQEAKSDVDVDIIVTTVDVDENRATRAAWGLFRDRRPELYAVLKTKDGVHEMNL